jgi:hypothetical protein
MRHNHFQVLAAAGGIIITLTTASAQWTDNAALNTPAVVAPRDQDVSKLAVTSDGSSWYGWFDFQPGGIEVRVQRLTPDGNQTFASDGLVVSTHPQNSFVVDWDLRTDADGNCMLAFTDTRAGPDTDVYAYLIAPDGTMLWGTDGVTISDNADFEVDPRIIQNSDGDYIVVWPRFDAQPGLYMQRLNPAGTPQLASGGVLIAGGGSESPAFVEMEPTELGDFVAVWVRDTATFFSPRHLHAQRFTASGSTVWGASPVVVMSTTVVPIAHKPRILEDHGGAVIGWHDTRDGDFDCYVQRIDALGGTVFPANGVAVSIEPARQQLDPAIAFDPTGDIMVFYRNMDGNQNFQGMNVQRIDALGTRAMGSAGVELLPFNNQFKGPPRAATINGGAAGITDLQPNSNVGNFDGVLQLMRVDSTGAYIDAGPIGVATTPSGKGRLAMRQAPGGALIAQWADDRNGTKDVYAQRINADGSLGGASCAPDLTGDGVLDFFDVQAFLQAFAAEDTQADFTGDGIFDFFDVQEFLAAFAQGCP